MPADPFETPQREDEHDGRIEVVLILGIDAHKRTHPIVAVDERGRQVAQRNIKTTTDDHLEPVTWADGLGADRLWAIEDCRHLSRRLERDLLGAGEQVLLGAGEGIVRVPTKMMAAARKTGREHGKSDPIDALAAA
jgi:transposase